MKKLWWLCCAWMWGSGSLCAAETVPENLIRIGTERTELILRSDDDRRLRQAYFGPRLANQSDLAYLSKARGGAEAYVTHGMEDYFEPAIRVLHADGNPSLLLTYKEVAQERNDSVQTTRIVLQDERYPFEMRLFYKAYLRENVIVMWTEIEHGEKKPVTLYNYASSMLHFGREGYWLTGFSGDWAHEVNMAEQKLTFGKKVIDTKLGARANLHVSPFFLLGLDGAACEKTGDVLVGTLGWTGNFRFTFEVDNANDLRLIAGINPSGSEYRLPRGEVFRTPDFIFTYSTEGTGAASRDLHNWARKYRIKDGMGDRMTLLNNWEATYFDFDQAKLERIIADAAELGVDMFLLDDGWFGNKYPRSNDRAGLGDWQETRAKLPEGIGALTAAAKKEGVKFGLWIEPEMVNPKSELYEKHKDWVIHLPNREEYLYRNQMVLDLSNPAVQDFVFGVVDGLLTRYPEIAYFKWDCNSPITNIYSPYLGADKQSNLYVDYVRGLYRVLDRVAAKYPTLPMMLCSGGGGRTDYEGLRYFTEFWASDNTDPVERIFIQWGYSYLFPAKATAAHVTSWGKQSLKFRTDVAMMGKLGFDIRVDELSEPEREFARAAVANYNRLKPVILDGDLYRLVSPYSGEHSAVMYADKGRERAVVFAFNRNPRFSAPIRNVRLDGLEPQRIYTVREINRMPGARSDWGDDGQRFSGDYLMKVGLPLFSGAHLTSRVVEVVATGIDRNGLCSE